MKLILCSSSARRKELIKKLCLPYIVYPVNIDENIRTKIPESLVTKLALRKALAGAGRFRKGIAIGADTIVVLGDKIIGKPRDHRDAERILKKLSGTVHKVYTGLALIDCASGKLVVDYEVSGTKMRPLSVYEIKFYAGKHLDKAGAYAVQEKDDAVVEKIYGDYYNVVGLPLEKLKLLLKMFGKNLDFD